MNARLTTRTRSTLLTPDWVTVRGAPGVSSIVQAPESWADTSGHADATFYLEVAEVTNPGFVAPGLVLVQVETSPTADESLFVPIAGPVVATVTANPIVLKSASAGSLPLARFVRWKIVPTMSGNFDVTFRLRMACNKQTYFAPTQLGNCVFWVRGDRGLSFAATVITGWADQSTTNDVNKKLVAGTAPAFTLADSSYNNQPTISFAGSAYMTSNTWASPLSQANTWVVVGNPATTGVTQVAIESNDGVSAGQNIQQLGATNDITIGTTSTLASTTPWTTPGVVLAEFAGASSNIFFNNFTTPVTSGAAGAGGQPSLTVGSSDVALNPGGANFWNGTVAEIMAFGSILSATQKQLLKRYLNNRYALGIT